MEYSQAILEGISRSQLGIAAGGRQTLPGTPVLGEVLFGGFIRLPSIRCDFNITFGAAGARACLPNPRCYSKRPSANTSSQIPSANM